jgi:D-alanyl-D-alanine carboxypeptidase
MFDLDSGEVLWRRAAERALPMASLTKIMTALLVAEGVPDLRDRATIPVAAGRARGSRMGGLVAGRNVPVGALMHGLLLASGNDAAVALATHVGGSQAAFVARMNRRAARWGLRCTRFVDPHGLGRANRSCPADLARLAVRAMAVPRIAGIVRRDAARVWLGRGKARPLLTTNPLVRAGYPGASGLKTGYTIAAGRCLVAVVRQGSHRRGIVLLNDPDPGTTARRLLRAAARADRA